MIRLTATLAFAAGIAAVAALLPRAPRRSLSPPSLV